VLALLLTFLTAWRLARLVCKDEFPPSVALRDRVIGWAGTGTAWHYLVECIPCAGVYTSGAVVLATSLSLGLAAPLLYWGAAAALIVLLNDVEQLFDAVADRTAGDG
jgi:hypothetical protein